MTREAPPSAVVRLYARLARLLLGDERFAEEGAELVQLFADLYRFDRFEGGRLRAAGRCALEVRDLVRTAWREHRLRRRRRRGTGSGGWVDALSGELRQALRVLRKRPASSLLLLFTLAVGIGANTAVFSLVRSTLLRPLPYPDPQELLMVWETFPASGVETVPLDALDFLDYREQSTTLTEIGIFSGTSSSFQSGGSAQLWRGLQVSAGVLDAVRAVPQLGRLFDVADETADTAAVILSHSTWQARLGGREDVIGHVVSLDDRPHTVVGVLPVGFTFPPPVTYFGRMVSVPEPEFYRPLHLDRGSLERGSFNWFAIARRRSSATPETVGTDLGRIAERIEPELEGVELEVRVVPLQRQAVATVRPTLLVLLVGVLLVLLLVAVNVSTLLLVRAGARRREVALRLALGAARGRVLRQFLVESLLLAVVASLLGVGVALVSLSALVELSPVDLPPMFEPRIDLWALGFAVGVSVAAACGSALAPALRSSRTSLTEAMGGRAGSDLRWTRTRALLVVSEVALATILLVAAGLVGRSFYVLVTQNPGFRAEGLVTFGLFPTSQRLGLEEPQRLFERIRDHLEALPGVVSVTVTNRVPLPGSRFGVAYRIQGGAPPEPGAFQFAELRIVDERYFETLGLSLRQGRAVRSGDRGETAPVVLVSESFARRHFGDRGAVGRFLRLDESEDEETTWREIVGVVADSRSFGLDQEPELTIYQPQSQREQPMTGAYFAVQTAGPAAQSVAPIRVAVAEVEPGTPLFELRSMREALDRSVRAPRFLAYVTSVFATAALLLAAIGLYGVVAHTVAERRAEIALRMALGAEPKRILAQTLRRGLLLTAAGMTIGGVGALLLAPLIAGVLFGVAVDDPATLALVPLTLVAVTAVASLAPAWRASRVDPARTLRAEV